VERLSAIEAHRQQERAVQHQKTLELERSRQKQRQGPTMEL
ncbi:Mobilization protein mbeA, partial [Klebsiella pneumoniae]|nr:Mobilization protein mbeA [Klebsiella pneumoniae]MDT9671280.1 Mobilization protein mbeA [Klebsiella pneumoniae]